MNTDCAHRLKRWRLQSNLSQRDLASQLNVSQGYIGNLEASRSEPSRNFLLKLEERFGLSADWLLYGRGEPLLPQSHGFQAAGSGGHIHPVDYSTPMSGDFRYNNEPFAMIRRMNLSISAGNGLAPVEDGEAESLAVSRSWLLRHGLSADLCFLIQVKGDSMSPTIPDGALVLVNAAERWSTKPGIYAFTRDGDGYVKRIAPGAISKEGRVESLAILSDNPEYETKVLVGRDLNDYKPVGRIRAIFSAVH